MNNREGSNEIVACFKNLVEAELYCLKCGHPLKLIDGGPPNMCGAILTYQCQNPKCGKKWKSDQSGMMPRPTNLTEVL